MTREPTNWGRWGTEDERGAANLVTQQKSLQALGLPQRGQVYNLAQSLQPTGVPMVSDRPHPIHLFAADGGDYAAGARQPNGCCSAEDYLIMGVHGHATHIDSLGHVWNNEHIYNGFSSNTVRGTGMRRCGIDKLGHIVTRGLLLDIPRLRGVSRLGGGETLTPDDLEQCLARNELTVEPGDAVLIRTGWFTMYGDDPVAYEAAWPGIGIDAAHWLAALDVVLVGVDNPSVESRPFPPDTTAPVHQILLRDYGIYMLELLELETLADDGVTEFLFVAAPLRFRGATGSPLSPLAIV
jgi:kynurenine formamidase